MYLKSDFIDNVSYLLLDGEMLKAVVITEEFCRSSVLKIGGRDYLEEYNYSEPYDFFTHVFLFSRSAVKDGEKYIFGTVNAQDDSDYFDSFGEYGEVEIFFREKDVHTKAEQYELNDSGLTVCEEKRFEAAEGVTVSDFTCKDKTGAPVKAFMFTVNVNKASLYCGTPYDGYECINKKQTVEGEARAAAENGKNVIGAVNADFFDMFGDFSPSGLCVKNAIVVANPVSDRPFFAIQKNGNAMISRFADGEISKDDILQAVGGRPILLKNGELADYQELEPFGFTRHPRTAVGVREDGTVLVLVVDGRLPAYSNGATLLDTALFLRGQGARDALNLDGGGSCTFLVRNGEHLDLINNPADLFRPADKLIRDVFDSLLIVE